MANTPNIGLPRLTPLQASAEQNHNEAINRIDALVQGAVIDRTTTTPPSVPADGARYIVAAGATGAWSGHDNEIAAYYTGWKFTTPQDGFQMWCNAENGWICYRSGEWRHGIIAPTRTDANRGSAAIAGRIIYNSDDGKINVDTGSGWTLADGTPT